MRQRLELFLMLLLRFILPAGGGGRQSDCQQHDPACQRLRHGMMEQ
jgi:hypothetical protein